MLTPSATFWAVIISILSAVIAVFALVASLKKFSHVLKDYLKNNDFFVALQKTLLAVFWPLILVIAITVVIGFAFYKFGMVPDSELEATYSPPAATLTPEPTPSIYSPITYSLDDLQVLNKEPDQAFFFHQWEKNFPIKIDNKEYVHSIGVQLPVDVEYDLLANHTTERKGYSAVIEYSLAYKYDMFQFKYGIDDNAFKDAGLRPPNCHYWVLVESCICDEDSEVKTIELEKTLEVNYMQTIGTSNPIDISNVETLRITFYWLFDVIPTKPLTLNVAIVDPTLYVRAD